MKKLLLYSWIFCLLAVNLQLLAQTNNNSLKNRRPPSRTEIDGTSRNNQPEKRACLEQSASESLRFQNLTYTITYLKHISARIEQNGHYYSDVVIEIERISPTIDYKGFDLTDLFKGNIEVTVRLQRLNGQGQVVDTKTFKESLSANEVVWRYNFPDFDSSKDCPLNLQSVTFTLKSSSTLQQRTQLIDEYVQQLSKLEAYAKELNRLEEPNLSNLSSQVDELNNLSYKIKALERYNFSALNLTPNSSEDFAYQLSILQTQYNDLQATLPNIYYDAGIQKLRYPAEAKKYFEATLRLYPQHIGARNEIANFHFAENNISAYLQDIEELEKLRYDGTERLVNKAFNWYLDAASMQANHPTEYEAAMLIYEDAKHLCKYGYVRDCYEQLESRKRRTIEVIGAQKTQLYETMLYDAMQAANYNRFGDAQNLLRQAALYQQNNHNWIPLTISTHQTLSHVYCTMINDANQQIQRGSLIEARQALDQVNVLENDWKYWSWTRNDATCGGQLEQAYVRLYQSYLNNSNQLTNQNNFKAARQSLTSAQDLCRQQQFNCGNELEQAYFKIQEAEYKQTIEKGQQQLRSRRYLDAVTYFETAENICSQDDRITCANSLAGGLYDSYMALAQQKAAAKEYEKATDYFRKAQQNIDRYQPVNYANLQRQLMEAMQGVGENYVADKMVEAEQAIRKNELWEANNIRGEIDDLIATYQLQSDRNIGDKMEEINGRIQSQQCINTAKDISDRYLEAKRLTDNQQFVIANATIGTALQLSYENADCQIATQKLVTLQNQILPAVEYQQMMDVVNNLVKNRSYTAAIDAYLKAGEHAEKYQLSTSLKLNHASLYEFLQQSDIGWLQVAGVQYFHQQKDWNQVRSLMRILATAYSSKAAKDFFSSLGTDLARADKQNTNFDVADLGIEQYQLNSFKIYKKFKKAYAKQWKN
ncbi:MAG: hypothetical protein R3E32_02740 [Chitinophagales bacterium]